MRYFFAMLIGAGAMAATFIGFPWVKRTFEMPPNWQVTGGTGQLKVDSRPGKATRTSTSTEVVPDETDVDLKAALAVQESRRLELARREAELARTWGHIQNSQADIVRIQMQIESELFDQLDSRLLTEDSLRAKRQREQISQASDGEKRRLMVDAYRSMTPEGLAEVVQDLAKEQKTHSAVTVLSVLEDRKAAKVLSLVAEPQPRLAAALTEKLKDGPIRIQ